MKKTQNASIVRNILALSGVLLLIGCQTINGPASSQSGTSEQNGDPEINFVTVVGEAANCSMAKDAALLAAVEKGVGTFLTSEQIVENYVLIKSKILAYSAGFVDDYKIVGEKQLDNGTCRVILQAIVVPTAIRRALEAISIPFDNIRGYRIVGKEKTKRKAIEDAGKILESVLRGADRKLFQIRVSGVQELENNKGIQKQYCSANKKSRSICKPGSNTLIVDLLFGFNPEYIDELFSVFERLYVKRMSTLPDSNDFFSKLQKFYTHRNDSDDSDMLFLGIYKNGWPTGSLERAGYLGPSLHSNVVKFLDQQIDKTPARALFTLKNKQGRTISKQVLPFYYHLETAFIKNRDPTTFGEVLQARKNGTCDNFRGAECRRPSIIARRLVTGCGIVSPSSISVPLPIVCNGYHRKDRQISLVPIFDPSVGVYASTLITISEQELENLEILEAQIAN